MSLNWLVKDIADQNWAWPKATELYGEDGPLPIGVKRDHVILNPKLESMIWATIPVGMNKITTENYEQFYQRYLKWSFVCGFVSKNEAPYFSLEDVKKAVGLSTNAASRTTAAFNKLCAEKLDDTVMYLQTKWDKDSTEKKEDNDE